MFPELIALAPQIESILAAANLLAATVEAIQATTPEGKKLLADIDASLARIQAHASDVHVQITGKRPEKTTTVTTTTESAA